MTHMALLRAALLVLALPSFACSEVLGAKFDRVSGTCDSEGERRCGDGVVCRDGTWQPDDGVRFCHQGNVAFCSGTEVSIIEDCVGPCVGAGNCTRPIEIGAGDRHTCALLDDGEVWCWGQNVYGEIGRPTSDTNRAPGPVVGVKNAVDLAMGEDFACVVLDSGRVACWGNNTSGQLGDGTTQRRYDAREVVGLDQVVKLFAIYAMACAHTEDGSTSCWGDPIADSDCSLLPPGPFGPLPTKVPGLEKAADLFGAPRVLCRTSPYECCSSEALNYQMQYPALGEVEIGSVEKDFACVKSEDQSMYCWGTNASGQLCQGDLEPRSEPAHVLDSIADVQTSRFHAYALTTSGDVLCCGKNMDGQCGYATVGEPVTTPIVALQGVKTFAAGGEHACGLGWDDRVLCWGNNDTGATGTGQKLQVDPVPVQW